MAALTYVALVPMKGHSERISGKNLRLLAGKPLCFWVLDMLTGLDEIETIVVNTDSPEIARRVRDSYDVVVHDRPAKLCGDLVSMNDIVADDLSRLPEHPHFVQTHATNPLLGRDTLRTALAAYERHLDEYDSVFSVTRHQARFFDLMGHAINHDPKTLLRTQDLPPIFEENSNFYVFSRASFARVHQRIGARPRMVEVPLLEAVDIDTFAHWKLAELLLRARHDNDA